MRLSTAGVPRFSMHKEEMTRPSSEIKPPSKRKWPYIALILLLVVVVGLKVFHKVHKTQPSVVNANTSIEKLLKNSKTIQNKRDLASVYLAEQNYEAAEKTMKSVAGQTGSVNDYMTLINICAVHNVPDKQACVDNAVSHIRPEITSLPFNAVYALGSELDEAGFKKDAVIFYQRAYDIYDPTQADAYTKTKDQIKQRIGQLNG